MRYFIFAIFTTFLTFNLNAQNLHLEEIEEETIELTDSRWTIGPRVGLGLSTTKAETNLVYLAEYGIAYELNFIGNTSSKSLGVAFDKSFDFAFIQFALFHTSYGSSFDVTSFGEKDKTSKIFYETYRNLEIPVLAGGKYKRFTLGVGPVLKYNLKTKSDFAELQGYEMKNSQINFGSQAAFGIDLGIFSIDIRYIKSFDAIGENVSFGGDQDNSFKNRPSELKLTIGTSF